MNGFLVIDKPGGMTSRDVVNRVQKWFPRKTKIGHCGTLDPLATGVLVVCVGAATRLADYVQMMGKSYSSRFRFGGTSTTDDADGVITERLIASPPTREQIEALLPKLTGVVEQVPPAFSALKVQGKRAHAIARIGEEVYLTPRTVRIDAIRVVGYEWPFLDVEVDCGKGTYIRSIARDLGNMLGCGGLVQALRRTRIGDFTVEKANDLEVTPEEAKLKMLPKETAVTRLAQVTFDSEQARKFVNGQLFNAREVIPHVSIYTQLAVFNEVGKLIGIAIQHEAGTVRPVTVFRE